jgi:hypothetical protein
VHKIYQKEQQMHCGFINLILLHTDNRHVSATQVTIFRVIRARIRIHVQCIGVTPQLKIIVCVKIPVKFSNGDDYKILEFENCCLECGSVV